MVLVVLKGDIFNVNYYYLLLGEYVMIGFKKLVVVVVFGLCFVGIVLVVEYFIGKL